METVKVSSKGQIVIPKALRDAFAIVPGTRFVISAEGDEIRLRPAPSVNPTRAIDGLGLLARKGRKRMREDETRAAIAALLLERDRKTRAK
jgi:AbrB family looped-hinge helix DNA binding protein